MDLALSINVPDFFSMQFQPALSVTFFSNCPQNAPPPACIVFVLWF